MIVKNGRIILKDQILEGSLRIQADRIAGVFTENAPEDEAVLDAQGAYVCPGFIDIHAHGGGGIDFLDNASFDQALQFHAKNGTTAMLASALTSPPELIVEFCGNVRKEMQYSSVERRRSRLLGAHIEGPYLSQKNKGAQPESCLLVPSRNSYDFLLGNADVIRSVTLSPELDGADMMAGELKKRGILVCGGHDNGRKSQFQPAIEAGVSHLTHLWCAMSMAAMYDGVREVGLCEYGLVNDQLSVEIIADNHHMPAELVQIVYRCKGAEKMCVVSDCLRAGGMPQNGERWVLGRTENKLAEFIVSDGVARLPDNTRLAGSIQPAGQMVRNLVHDCGIPLCEAVRMATLTPAEILGVADTYGSLSEGKKADFCILDDNLQVQKVFIDGVKIYG